MEPGNMSMSQPIYTHILLVISLSGLLCAHWAKHTSHWCLSLWGSPSRRTHSHLSLLICNHCLQQWVTSFPHPPCGHSPSIQAKKFHNCLSREKLEQCLSTVAFVCKSFGFQSKYCLPKWLRSAAFPYPLLRGHVMHLQCGQDLLSQCVFCPRIPQPPLHAQSLHMLQSVICEMQFSGF